MTEEGSTSLVSVVMPVHAGLDPAHLREAIESVLSQTYSALELIVVCDGEVGAEIAGYLSECTRADDRVRVLSLPRNEGPASARNAGIARARGAFIALLDGDDRALPERIERQVAFLRERAADLVGSQYRVIDESGAVTGRKYVPLDVEDVRRMMYLFNPIANSTVLARACVLKDHPFPTAYRYGEDYSLWVTLARLGYALRNQPEFLVDFRSSSNFLHRRRGLHPALTELTTKLRTLPLYRWCKRPWVVAVSITVALLRLLPAPVLAGAYRLRNRQRFFSGAS